jgi:hypothetical protein
MVQTAHSSCTHTTQREALAPTFKTEVQSRCAAACNPPSYTWCGNLDGLTGPPCWRFTCAACVLQQQQQQKAQVRLVLQAHVCVCQQPVAARCALASQHVPCSSAGCFVQHVRQMGWLSIILQQLLLRRAGAPLHLRPNSNSVSNDKADIVKLDCAL